MASAINDVAALGRTLLTLTSVIQNLGDNYFRAHGAWRAFFSRVKMLESNHKLLVTNLERFGIMRDTPTSFSEAITATKKLIDGEVTKLEKRRGRPKARSCSSYICVGVFFQRSVDTSLQVVEEACERIWAHLDRQLRVIEVCQKYGERQPLRPAFDFDEHYVPLQVSEEKILRALREAGTKRAVVVLSGGPGTGKSTLMRQIGLKYREGSSEGSSNRIQMVKLDCGQNVDVAAKQMEFLQRLGGYCVNPESDGGDFNGGDFNVDSSAKRMELQKHKAGVRQNSQAGDFSVETGLQARLQTPDLLVILDDLWEAELLSSLVNLAGPESGAKWLVTSQRKNIGDSLNCKCVTRVEMENLSQENSRKILASHVGFEDKTIPSQFQVIADKMIEKADALPLELAILGALITSAGQSKLEVWESVLDDIFVHLDGTLPTESLGSVHGERYPRTLTATMERSIGLLNPDRKQLLVLISMCRVASIPMGAFQYLYNTAISRGKCSLLNVRIGCQDLETRHLLEVLKKGDQGAHPLSENANELLSIHSLTKRFILNQMTRDVDTVKMLLNGKGKDFNPPQPSVTSVLADLFIDAKFTSRATGGTALQSDLPSRPRISSETLPHSVTITMEVKRTTSESIMELLVLEARATNEWTEELGTCVKRVLLEFVNKEHLDQESISKLLGSSRSVLPVLTFLKNVCLLEKSFWEENFIKSSSSLPKALSEIFRQNLSTDFHNQAASVLAALCWSNKENSNAIANVSGMQSQLTLFLTQSHDFNLQEYGAKVLAAWAFWDYHSSGTIVSRIVIETGLVDSLVDLLARDNKPSAQIAAAHALSNLAAARPAVKQKDVRDSGKQSGGSQEQNPVVSGSPKFVLANRPDLLDVLVKSLSKTENPVLQAHASSTLARIASDRKNEIIERLVDHAGLLHELVSLLHGDHSARVQKESARAICILAWNGEGSLVRQKILRWPGLVDGLVKSLLKSENPLLQVNAAQAISHLVFGIERDTAQSIVNHPTLVENLMQLLDGRQDSNVQGELSARAVKTLCSLTDIGDDKLRATIVRSPTILANLTQSVLTGKNRKLEADAACLMANLAVTNEKAILDALAGSPGLVERLAESLAEDESPVLQVYAIRALLNLAGEQSNDNFDISSFPELLLRLQNALLHRDLFVLRERIEAALTFSMGADSVNRRGGTWIVLLDEFVKRLSKESNVISATALPL